VFDRYQDVIDESAQKWPSTYLVFQEGFQSVNNWTTTRGQFDVDDQGRYYNTQNGENRSFIDYQGNDFQMSIDVAHLTEGQGYGVWFRANDIDASSGINGYTFQYDPGYGGGAFLFRKWENGHERSPFGRIDVSDFAWYEEHEITLQVEGNTFTAFVNGEPVVTAQDDAYESGTVGLRTWGNSRAYFDDISIEEH
jgi:fructan beta-fructosidase